MKRHSIHPGSCSCTSCVYRSRSKQPSLQNLIHEGSRIDQLYYGKYLPLRERKLLEKLIRTRAVYDDVRNQLLSTSGSSDQTRSEHKLKRRDDDSSEKSSAVLKIIDLVDRGQIGSSNNSKLSSCCSCCSCSSLRKIKKRMEKHPRVHRHHVPYEEIEKYTAEAEKRGKKRRKRLSTKITSKVRAVKYKVKQIRSEPCTCTLSLRSIIKRPSGALIKKVRLKEKQTDNAQAQKVVSVERNVLIKKIHSCSCKIAEVSMKSLKRIKNLRKRTSKTTGTEMGNQRVVRIKTDSIMLYKENLQKKRAIKDWECEPGTCVVDECLSEHCFIKVKARGVGKTKKRKHHTRTSGTGKDRTRISMSTHPRKVKQTDSQVDSMSYFSKPAASSVVHKSNVGSVICECEPTFKSTSSMTIVPKKQALKSVSKRGNKKFKRRPHLETVKTHEMESQHEKDYKTDVGSVICECKPTIKLTSSMTTAPKTQTLKYASTKENKTKRTMKTKWRPHLDALKTHEVESKHQNAYKPDMGSVTCECKPTIKSTSSMTTTPKTQTLKYVSSKENKIKRMIKSKRRSYLEAVKSHEIQSKQEIAYKTDVGSVICECKPTIKLTSSMTTAPKTQTLKYASTKQNKTKRTMKPKWRPHLDALKTHEVESKHQNAYKPDVGSVTCECKPTIKSTSSMTTTPKAQTLKYVSSKENKIKRMIKSKRRSYLEAVKSHDIQSKQEIAYKTDVGSVICECKRTIKLTSSMTTDPKTRTLKYASTKENKTKRTMKPKWRPHLDALKTHEVESKHQNAYKPDVGSVTCECKPTIKSTSSMTTTPKTQTLKYGSSKENKMKRVIKPKRRSYLKAVKSHEIQSKQENAYKTDVGSVICECKPIIKLTSSITTAPKTQTLKYASTKENKTKRTMKPKWRPHLDALKTHEVESKHQNAYKPDVGSVTCECKPTIKSTSSMTTTPKAQTLKYVSSKENKIKRMIKSKRRSYLEAVKSHEIQSKQENAYKTDVGSVICECKPIIKLTSSMTTAPKTQTLKYASTKENKTKRTMKPKRRPHLDALNTHEVELKHQNAYKSDVGSVICECKPTIKSTSSMTTTPKTQKYKNTYKTRRHKHPSQTFKYHEAELKELRIESAKQETEPSSSFKQEMEFSKKRHPAFTYKELFEHVKDKRAKRNRPKHRGRKQNEKYPRETKSSQESHVSFLRDSASQASKRSRNMILPFPRECEPLMCIPYECDPEHCAQILLSRSKSRGRPAISVTSPLRRKSAGSTTPSLNTSSKSKYIHSKSMESLVRKSKVIPKISAHHIMEKDVIAERSDTHRQAVKIESTFSFNIEFYKQKETDLKTDKLPQKHFTQKVRRNKRNEERGHGSKKINSRNMSSQSRSSQSVKYTQIDHKLKRCFCTFKLLQKKKEKVKHAASKKKMTSHNIQGLEKQARVSETQKHSSSIVYAVPPIKSLPTSLLRSECECAKITKSRHRKGVNRGSNTDSTPRKSKLSSTTQALSKSSSKIQSSAHKHKKKTERSHASRIERQTDAEVSSGKLERQAVRIGSSFTFNMEFSKEKHDKKGAHEKDTKEVKQLDKPIKTEKKQEQQKGIKVHKPRVRHATSKTTKNVKAKQTYTTSFLQRCICNLKFFQKKQKKKAGTLTPIRNKKDFIHMQNKSLTTNRANIRYHEESDLLPYECEPGICIPDKCDPYECEKLIQLRNVKLEHKYSNTGELKTRSKFSGTPRTITSPKSQNTQSYIRGSKVKAKKIKDTNRGINDDMNVTLSHSKRQAVRVGSSFSFNIEFYKENPSTPDNRQNVKISKVIHRQQTRNKQLGKQEQTKAKLKAVGSQLVKPRSDRKAVNAEVRGTEKGIYVGSAIKRCFCTLKLHKKGKNERLQENNKVISKSTKSSYPLPNTQVCECKSTKTLYPSPSPQICACKSTSTKKTKAVHDLKSYECAPDFCTVGSCDPYECHEEIKRRGIKQLHDRYITTDKHKRKSIRSNTNFSSSSKAKSIQSSFINKIPKQDHKVRVVQKSMTPARSYSPTRHSVRIGSNLNFKIEFFKDRSAPHFEDTTYKVRAPKYNTASDTTMVKKIKDQGTKDKQGAFQHRPLQANNIIKKENKGSNVGFMLKRCFCTLGLQKKKNAPKAIKHKRELHLNRPLTALFLQVLQVDRNQKKTKNLQFSTSNKKQCIDIVKSHLKINPRFSFPNRNSVEESLQLKLPRGNHYCKEENSTLLFANTHVSQHSTVSNSFTKSTHFNSCIDFNFDVGYNMRPETISNLSQYGKYQVGYLLKDVAQKINPFYHSFYALNVQVSNLKNGPTHTLEHHKCEPGVCMPHESDPAECLKRINSRKKRSKLAGTNHLQTKSVTNITKSKLETKGNKGAVQSKAGAHLRKFKQMPSQISQLGHPKKQKCSHPSRQVLRVGSDFSFAMEFYKDSNSRSDDVMMAKSGKPNQDKNLKNRYLKTCLRHPDSGLSIQYQNKATGISSPLLKRCFCTRKQKDKCADLCSFKKETETNQTTKSRSFNKQAKKTKKNNKKYAKGKKDDDKLVPYEYSPNICIPGECDPRECYRLKNLREHAVDTDQPKQKSTSNLMRKGNNIKTKTVHFKSKECSAYPKKNDQVFKKQYDLKPHLLTPLEKQALTFGSNVSFNIKFFKQKSRSLSSHLYHASAASGPKIYKKSLVCPGCETIIKGSGDNHKKNIDNEQTGMYQPIKGDAENNDAHMVNKCLCYIKRNQKGSKGDSMSKEIKKDHNTIPVCKCTTLKVKSILKPYEPLECERRIKKRRVRSKSTKVNRAKKATAVKSAVIDQGTLKKGKLVSQSFENDAYIPGKCDPHDCKEKIQMQGVVGPHDSQNITQNFENKSIAINSDKHKTSILKRCLCILTLKKGHSKQSISKINKIKCDVCKPVKDSGIKKQTDLNKVIKKCFCTLKLTKKGKTLTPKQSTEGIRVCNKRDTLKHTKSQKYEMKLKKKADTPKHTVKQVQEMETIMPYSKKKFKRHESQTKLAQETTDPVDLYPCRCPKKQLGLCPECKARMRAKNKNAVKKALYACICRNYELDLCPACKAHANAISVKKEPKKNKKRSKKLTLKSCSFCSDQFEPQNTDMIEVKTTKAKKSNYLQNNEQSDLCPRCKSQKTAKTKSDKKKTTEHNGEQNKIKETLVLQRDDQMDLCSSCKAIIDSFPSINDVLNKIKRCLISSEKKKEKVNEKLSKININLSNKKEALFNVYTMRIGSMAREGVKKGKVAPPPRDMLTDENYVNDINIKEIHKNATTMKCCSLRAAETRKKASVKNSQSERTTPSRLHGNSLKNRSGISSKQKSGAGDGKLKGAKVTIKPHKLNACVCGSVLCRKDWEKFNRELIAKQSVKKVKPCICGSKICAEQTRKMPELLLKAARKAQRNKEKQLQAIKMENTYQKRRLRRNKIYAKEDAELWRRRKKRDRDDMRHVKKYENEPDSLLAVESFIDFGKFGAKAAHDLLKSTYRVVKHPIDSVVNLKDVAKHPRSAAKQAKAYCDGMGFIATMARIKQRFMKMKVTKSTIAKLESLPVTNYIMHLPDKNPKKRMKKFKKKRQREQLDFECSLFMASLRKRPCLPVYYTCPWFYPHCVSLLGVWKQFTDILLFILAVGVWSPCILTMELCRAMMCCCLCTG